MIDYIKKRKKLTSLLIVFIILTGLITTYFLFPKKEEEKYEVQEFIVSSDIAIADDLGDMVDADVIVVGYFNEMIDKTNMQRDVNDPLKESSHLYDEGHIYEFKLEDVIAGEIEDNKIPVVLEHSFKDFVIDKEGDKKDITILSSLYKEPIPDQKYVLFLHKNEYRDMYNIPFRPFRLTVNEKDVVEIDSILVDESYESEVQITRLEETKEEIHVIDDVYVKIEDKISGKTLSEIKEFIKEKRNH